jgi:uncharacterized DUF497 family protein
LDQRQYQFEWDEEKAASNIRKHGVSFDLAATVFHDPRLLSMADLEHSTAGDERWFSIGLASTGAALTIVYQWTERTNAEITIRLISARKATRGEIRSYGQEA